jgi:hypothetical protein
MSINASKTTFASSAPRQAAFIVYINGLEVPAKSVSLKFGVWDLPEMQIEMVADPVLIRLGNQDRVQVAVFYLDDCEVDPSVTPQFRLFGEGEITGWGYKNTSAGRSIIFTVVSQIAIWQQMIVQFLTNVDDMAGHATLAPDPSESTTSTIELAYPYALFKQGLVPGANGASTDIVRPFDYLYNCVKAMISSTVPANRQAVPASNFYARWARLTNFHNRFVASPFFDDTVNNPNIFPVLRALQDVSAVNVITKNLLPQLQGAGTFWDMIQIVFTTMLMEVAMIPSMPLVSVDLASSVIQQTNFNSHVLVDSFGSYVSNVSTASRTALPLRIPNFFVKPQSLFGIPPTCNVIFPSQLKTIAYQENYATQPTRLYYNDEVVNQILQMQNTGVSQSIMNSLAVGYPPEVDQAMRAQSQFAGFNSKNFLVYPEEFFKGPVVLRSKAPSWLYFLKQGDNKVGGDTAPQTADGGAVAPPPPATQTANIPPPTPPPAMPGTIMVTKSQNGRANADGSRSYVQAVENLRSRVTTLNTSFAGGRIPTDFILTWINMESGGNVGSAGLASLHETGLFQLSSANAASTRTPQFPNGINQALTTSTQTIPSPTGKGTITVPADSAITTGLAFILYSRNIANKIASQLGLGWTEGDMWRLTKLCQHNVSAGSATIYIQAAIKALGRPPTSWSEFYNAVMPNPPNIGLFSSAGGAGAINNATACGGTVATASGTMVSGSDPRPFTAPNGVPAAPSPSYASTAVPAPVAASASPAAPTVTPAQATAAANEAPDVYHLYAKYEYFRARYAKRSGSATVVWNPYVVPGFPMALFDQRATRVDLFAYVTAVQQYMDHAGQRSTTLSFMYGRQFQEMFADLENEFKRNNATVRGSAPQEPINEISQVVQSFIQSETYYEGLFFGGQQLFNKPASFDFRTVIGYAPSEPGGSPTPIFINGPDTVSQATTNTASATINSLLPLQTSLTAAVADLNNQVAVSQALIASTNALDPFNTPIVTEAQITLAAQQASLNLLQTQLTSVNTQITAAQTTLISAQAGVQGSQVQHNLDPTQELVPLPASDSLFESREAAEKYNWRPICTLDEYVTFYNSSADGVIPAFGHPKSVGAQYYERIRTFTYPVPNADGTQFTPPTGTTGVGVTNVPGLTSSNFPQVGSDWDEALVAYRDNVLNPAPRT